MSDISTQGPLDTPELLDLAGRIRREHDQCREAMQAGLQHAIAAGLLLIEAKAQCPKGAWLSWVTEHCAMSKRTAQAYMHVAMHREQLADDAQRVAGLSFRQALALLSTHVDTPTDESPELRQVVEELTGALDPFERVKMIATQAYTYWRARLADPSISLRECLEIQDEAEMCELELRMFAIDMKRRMRKYT